MSESVRLTLDEVHALATETFLANGGFPRADPGRRRHGDRGGARRVQVARTLPGAGVHRVDPLRQGESRLAEPKLTRLAPGVVKVDGLNGFAPPALEAGREPLVDLAREQGIAALAITNTHHFAALWPETEALAERGLVGFAFVAAMAYVAPAGGTKPLYGTNPMSFAWPRGDGRPPLVFDQASSASARGEIMIHQRDGHPLPDGWAIDADGNSTTDPAAALAGAQLPFGGYKGASIALMIELLAGALVGDLFSFEASEVDPGDGGPPRGGELVLAIDPEKCSVGGDPIRHAEALFARILEQEGARLPSDRRYAARQRTPTEGITIPRTLHDTIQSLRRP